MLNITSALPRPLLLGAAILGSLSSATGFSPEALAAPAPAEQAAPAETAGNPRALELNERGVAALATRDFKGAESLFRQALAADPKNLTIVTNLAAMHMTNRQPEAAVKLLEQYTSSYRGDAALFARLGDAYFATRKVKEAAASYDEALRIDPALAGVSSRAATVYLLVNRTADAERLLLRAVEENPRDGQALASLSSVFLANGKPELAVSTAKRALQVQPGREIYITLGAAYEVLKDYRNSLIAFERAADLGQSTPELTAKIAELRAQMES